MSENIKQITLEETYQMEQNTDKMSENKRGFIIWVKTHKKQLILAGVGLTTIIGIILRLKSKDAIEALWDSLEECVKKVPIEEQVALPDTSVLETVMPTRKYTSPTEKFDVSRHIRTMAVGRHHSAEKAAEAAALGIELLPNQTIVDTYAKCVA